jgi:ATP-independent RNA helicase DbpA
MSTIEPPAATATPSSSSTRFECLALNPATLANLQQLGYLEMTPIQAASLPAALAGKDLIAQAETGSGKTAAFALALLERLNPRRFAVQALVLCPTRELADQVTIEIRRLARATDNVKVVTLCGGVALRGQRASLEQGAHIVVGTPGRVMDHLAREYLNLEALNTLVLDEADRMLDMGFFEDMATNPAVFGHLPGRHRETGQTIHARAAESPGGGAANRKPDRATLLRGHAGQPV